MISLGQLKEIKDLREVWPHEALDFTKKIWRCWQMQSVWRSP